ncbi:MAG: helicase [Planctomycetaceae bacterium]|nr:MAG: helicase [Planctomycetaceae bacterium]
MTDQLTCEDILGPGGLVARHWAESGRYELRPQQLEMAQAVAQALAESKHLLVEAGTGTGKSFAYLVPAILAVTQHTQSQRLRIVISTHTIALQEQLIHRDLPFLNAILPVEFSAVLVKGRGNYVSLRRLKRAYQQAGHVLFRMEDSIQLEQLSAWVRETRDGSRSELREPVSSQVWEEVASDPINCLSRRCPTYDRCFFFKARKRAWNADLLVVNHALFFHDLLMRREDNPLLPEYHAVIFDEAHMLEQVAAEHLGLSLSQGQIEGLMNRLYAQHPPRGLLLSYSDDKLRKLVAKIRKTSQGWFDHLQSLLDTREVRDNGRVYRPLDLTDDLSLQLAQLCEGLQSLADQVSAEDDRAEILSFYQRCFDLTETLETWRLQKHRDYVYWLDRGQGESRRLKLYAAPVEVGPILRQEVFQQIPTVVMTSATLTTGRGNFDYLKKRLGVTRATTLQLDSPFAYEQQAVLILCEDMPDPSDEAAYTPAMVKRIRRLIRRSRGRAFVLFTSYRLLQECYRQLADWLQSSGFGIYVQQTQIPVHGLIEQFRQDPAGVLFGTESCWQGIDIPGEALSNVIITKLPFAVPDHPLVEARIDAIRRRKGEPFRELQLPDAIIKLKQGFGRLIRTRHDRGMVAILDPRIITKGYGRQFLESLPKCRLEFDRQDEQDEAEEI